MRSLVNASLTYSLASVPVSVGTLAKDNEATFRTLHNACSTPVKQLYFCETCNRAIRSDETVKGYEHAKKEFVPIDSDELDAVKTERSPVIEITQFVPGDQVDPSWIDKTYWLAPRHAMERQYALLAATLARTGVMGVGLETLWKSERPCLIKSTDGVAMTMSLLFTWADVTVPDWIGDLPEISDKELELSSELVGMMTTAFDATRLRSPSRERVETFLAAKVAGIEYVKETVPEEVEPIPDITESIKKSIALIKAR